MAVDGGGVRPAGVHEDIGLEAFAADGHDGGHAAAARAAPVCVVTRVRVVLLDRRHRHSRVEAHPGPPGGLGDIADGP
jgi:hypothetical protein